MKAMNTPRGTTRAYRRANGGLPPTARAQAAQEADRERANRKLSVKLYHKSGEGIGGA